MHENKVMDILDDYIDDLARIRQEIESARKREDRVIDNFSYKIFELRKKIGKEIDDMVEIQAQRAN